MDVENNGTPEEVKNTEEHQSYIKYRLEKALKKKEPEIEARVRKSIADELGIDADDLQALKEELASKREKASEAERLTLEHKKLMKTLETERQEREALKAALESRTKEDERRSVREAIVKASDGYQVRNISQVVKLLEGDFAFEDGKIKYLENGEPTEKKIEDVVKQFFSNNEHFLTAKIAQGANSKTSQSGDAKSQSQKLLSRDERRQRFEAVLKGL